MIKFTFFRPRTLFLAIQVALSGAIFGLAPSATAADEVTPPRSWPRTPDVLLGPLFRDVQQAKLFADQKTFVDAVPKSDPLMILADYRMQRGQRGFDLNAFVSANFILPGENEKYVPPTGQSLREHINSLWPVLTRSTDNTDDRDSLLPLPKPYVVPGGRFREVYYWDSYFTMLGLAESGHWDMVRNMVENFAHEINTWGHIPNGNRSYYLSRSQPPFFPMMVTLLAAHDGDKTLATWLPEMKKEYAWWMEDSDQLPPGGATKRVTRLPDGALLNRYWDEEDTPEPESWLDDVTTARNYPARPATEIYRDLRAAAASGWDFSSRWMDDPEQLGSTRTTSIVPVDLNAMMFAMEKILARASQQVGDEQGASDYSRRADDRQHTMEKYLWNSRTGWYADYDLKARQVRNQLTAAALFPLYVSAASPDRAQKMAQVVQSHLLAPGGLATTQVHSGQQWDAPNGWAPLQWVAVSGLQNYGQQPLAMEITWRFLTNVQHTWQREQKMLEKYNVATTGNGGGGGEYPLQDGFGWSNGVTLKMLDLICQSSTPCNDVPTSRPADTALTPSYQPQH